MFQNITIKSRLIIYTIISVIGFALMLLLVNESIASVSDLKTAQTKVETLKVDMLMLRRNEKDFLARKDISYKSKFEENIKSVLKTSRELKKLLLEYNLDISKINQFEKIIKQYQKIFLQISIKQQKIGFTPTDGLYGKLRSSIHNVQNIAKTLKDDELLLKVYDLRKQEKDFMLRKDIKYVKSFIEKIDKLISSTTGDIRINLEQYNKSFLILTNIQHDIGFNSNLGLHGDMRNIVHNGENLLKQFSKELQNSIMQKLNKYESYAFILFIILMVLVIIVSYLILKSILKNLDELEKRDLQIFKSEKMASMGEMIGNIAHQWRQPLSVISTASTGMKLQKQLNLLSDKQLIKDCDMINDNAQYLSKTIEDFKNFIKGDREKSIFLLKNEINSCLHLLEGIIKTYNIKIILDLQEDIKINGYENELTQCLINIFNNAKDALKEHTQDNRLIFITTTLSQDNTILIKIKDNAKGIQKDIINKVFEPYFTTKHQAQGTGLGLHMTYNLIVDGMNGEINVKNVTYEYDNKNHIGAEFIIKLPLE